MTTAQRTQEHTMNPDELGYALKSALRYAASHSVITTAQEQELLAALRATEPVQVADADREAAWKKLREYCTNGLPFYHNEDGWRTIADAVLRAANHRATEPAQAECSLGPMCGMASTFTDAGGQRCCDFCGTPVDETQPTHVADEYLIRKGAYYYRPNAQGYTSCKAEAGRFSLEDAVRYSHPNGPDGPRDGITYELARRQRK